MTNDTTQIMQLNGTTIPQLYKEMDTTLYFTTLRKKGKNKNIEMLIETGGSTRIWRLCMIVQLGNLDVLLYEFKI